jgi:hypothetical protein
VAEESRSAALLLWGSEAKGGKCDGAGEDGRGAAGVSERVGCGATRRLGAAVVGAWRPWGTRLLPRSGVACAGEGAREVERASAEAVQADSRSGPKVGRRPSKQEKHFSFLFSNLYFTNSLKFQI